MNNWLIYILTGLLMLTGIVDPAVGRPNEKAKVRLSIDYFNPPDGNRYLTVGAKSRVDKRYQPVPGITIKIYQGELIESDLLGSVTLDENGTGNFILPPKFYQVADTANEYYFIASLRDDPNYRDKETELTVKEVSLEVKYIDQDSLKIIQASVFEISDSDSSIRQEDIELNFLVERPFSLLPIGGKYTTTDQDGNVTIEFPTDLPGDSVGNVLVIVRIEDSDDYGTVSKSNIANWGLPTSQDIVSEKRSLWAAGANAPVGLLFLVNSLIIATWGIILFIIYKIYRISRI